jgi:hypothetical protein
MHLYPNPVRDLLHVQVNLRNRGAFTLHVIDSSGRKVQSTSREGMFGPNSTSMDLSGLKEGLYHLQMIHKGRTISERFLKI